MNKEQIERNYKNQLNSLKKLNSSLEEKCSLLASTISKLNSKYICDTIKTKKQLLTYNGRDEYYIDTFRIQENIIIRNVKFIYMVGGTNGIPVAGNERKVDYKLMVLSNPEVFVEMPLEDSPFAINNIEKYTSAEAFEKLSCTDKLIPKNAFKELFQFYYESMKTDRGIIQESIVILKNKELPYSHFAYDTLLKGLNIDENYYSPANWFGRLLRIIQLLLSIYIFLPLFQKYTEKYFFNYKKRMNK